ncbi:MAG TPA: cytochrome c [Burkholderiales bacterium]|nr:cytochrome c [Burkholderiales bacterium]
MRSARFLQALLVTGFLCTGANTLAQYPPAAQCPQPRFTGKAPEPVYSQPNPLAADQAAVATGRRLYEKEADPSCQMCHGIKGDGLGPLSAQFDPRPRNFRCRQTVNGIPDGQLFWIVRNGSPGTSMPAFGSLRDEQIWQIVLYLRTLAQ